MSTLFDGRGPVSITESAVFGSPHPFVRSAPSLRPDLQAQDAIGRSGSQRMAQGATAAAARSLCKDGPGAILANSERP